eukprot:TRINITY_DN45809_c0_g1_i1.p1 TRINITY_DN45809_c0_g1~~TRINITY_DN45809_c0_g1_i1.p1  ORF type:complete len:475 (-),score=109.66 TRINITY_DN45809_c0_g1_i1:406-1638(-)
MVAAADGAQLPAAQLFAQPSADAFFGHLGATCPNFEPQQLRELLAEFATASHMPSSLWSGGFAQEVPRALAELPDLPAVHVALLLSSLEMRESQELLEDVAAQLEERAPDLPPAGLAGAAIALSQLGPWPLGSNPGNAVFEQVLKSLTALNPRELSACALAAATLGFDSQTFWQQMHGALIRSAPELAPRHMADTLLTLATHQLCPISLLEELMAQLPKVAGKMEPDEALTTAWSMCSMLFFNPGVLPLLIEKALTLPGLSPAEARQLRQICLSLELEPSAAKAKAALPEAQLQQLLELPCSLEESSGEAGEAIVQDLLERFGESQKVSVGEVVRDLYVLDLSVSGHRTIVLDAASKATSQVPQDPWTSLKCRHLQKLGWSVEWIPISRWHGMDDEDCQNFADDLLREVS